MRQNQNQIQVFARVVARLALFKAAKELVSVSKI